jgi:hypothetical protein
MRVKTLPLGATASIFISSRRLYLDSVTLKDAAESWVVASPVRREPDAHITVFEDTLFLLMTRLLSQRAVRVLDETKVENPEPVTFKVLLLKSA